MPKTSGPNKNVIIHLRSGQSLTVEQVTDVQTEKVGDRYSMTIRGQTTAFVDWRDVAAMEFVGPFSTESEAKAKAFLGFQPPGPQS